MRKIDKKLNLVKTNLLNEQRYLTDKEGLDEDWKTNLAAGLATAGGVAAGQAQQAPQQAQTQQTIQHQAPKQDVSGIADPFNTDNSAAIGHTRPIIKIQTGVQDGKTGNPSVYLYHKDPNDPSFNPATDRTTVFTKNLDLLRKTIEYQDYLKRMHTKKQQAVAVNESDKKALLENFNNVLKKLN